MGAALQFERWTARFWRVLRALAAAPGSRVALVHTTGALRLEAADAAAREAFEEVERIGGGALGMALGPEDGEYSDFEVVVLSRR